MQLRKGSKTKTVFPTDKSLMKILFLGTVRIKKKWTIPVKNWVPILN